MLPADVPLPRVELPVHFDMSHNRHTRTHKAEVVTAAGTASHARHTTSIAAPSVTHPLNQSNLRCARCLLAAAQTASPSREHSQEHIGHNNNKHGANTERLLSGCCAVLCAADCPTRCAVHCLSHRTLLPQIHATILSPHSCRFLTLPHYTRAEQQHNSEVEEKRQPEPEDEEEEEEDVRDSSSRAASPPSAAFELPDYDPATTLVLYPSPSAVELSDPSIADMLPHVRTVVVIESTWQKGGAVYSDPHLGLHRLQAVRLASYESTYWRYQELGRQALCTLEAIYHCCRELLNIEQQRGGSERTAAMRGSELDDLLYLYAAQHQRLQTRYQPEQQQPRGADSVQEQGGGDKAAEHGSAVSERQTRKKPPPRAWKPM